MRASSVCVAVCIGLFLSEAAHAQPAERVQVRTNGGGTVTSSDGRIDCGQDCSARYHGGRRMTLTAVPHADFDFTGWTRGCRGTAPKCVVAVGQKLTVRAAFVRRTRFVRLTVSGPGTVVSEPAGLRCGSGSTQCSALFGQGTTLTLAAVASPDGLFDAWSGAACAPGPAAICDVLVDADLKVSTTFRSSAPTPGDVPLTVTPRGVRLISEPAGIDCQPLCGASFPSGTRVRLVTADARPAAWSGACTGHDFECTVVVDQATGVTASFVAAGPPPADGVGLSVTVSGPGVVTGSGSSDAIRCSGLTGSLFDCQGVFEEDATVRLLATPRKGATFDGWSSFCQGKRRRCTVRLTAAKTVGAVFRR
jgi:Divergent InlB B-repeat domain